MADKIAKMSPLTQENIDNEPLSNVKPKRKGKLWLYILVAWLIGVGIRAIMMAFGGD